MTERQHLQAGFGTVLGSRAALCWFDVLRLQVERRRLDTAAVLRDTEAQGAV